MVQISVTPQLSPSFTVNQLINQLINMLSHRAFTADVMTS